MLEQQSCYMIPGFDKGNRIWLLLLPAHSQFDSILSGQSKHTKRKKLYIWKFAHRFHRTRWSRWQRHHPRREPVEVCRNFDTLRRCRLVRPSNVVVRTSEGRHSETGLFEGEDLGSIPGLAFLFLNCFLFLFIISRWFFLLDAPFIIRGRRATTSPVFSLIFVPFITSVTDTETTRGMRERREMMDGKVRVIHLFKLPFWTLLFFRLL